MNARGSTTKVNRKALAVVWMIAAGVLLAACAPNATQSALEPAGENAEKANSLFLPVFWVAVAIFVIVEGALLFFAIRYRHRKGRDTIPPQVHGNTRLEIAWTILPAVILAGVAVPTVATIFELARDPGPEALEVTVLGHQWWWEFDYPQEGVNVPNELHVPTGRPVHLTMCAVGVGYEDEPAPSECEADRPVSALLGHSVIHSFWAPELFGTQDVFPTYARPLTFAVDEPGVYEGQCKEFCGLSHAYMRFVVVAHTPAEFEQWVADQQAPAGQLDGAAPEGLQVFLEAGPAGCTQCHAVNGLRDANGEPVRGSIDAPNLSHFASRDCFAGCIFENTDENLRRWLADPPAMKPGSWMPDYKLTSEEIDQLIAFLNTLE
jgi:cytochrome c oxidase subunit II